ncbi:MAG: P1 family peptidase [Gammaproteobacteria bacterium]|nr:P1 family peptidase [Gammaproteobacteria bacterium]
MQRGARNLITDVTGLRVGNALDAEFKTGVTVLTAEQPFIASVDVMGGAPGTRETDLLAPDKVVESIDAIVLSGGSALGLDAASAVANALREQGRGYAVGPVRVPIVPAAIIFDLLAGGKIDPQVNPYTELGRSALAACHTEFALGSEGAGAGATTANLKGGLGSASLVLDTGITVGALVVVNAHGSAVNPRDGRFWAGQLEVDSEFGGFGPVVDVDSLQVPHSEKAEAFNAKANTTIAIVATDAELTKAQCQRMAVAAQDGMARALMPAHTPYDGDLVFALSTRPAESVASSRDNVAESMVLGHAAALCLSRAIARGVFMATPEAGDILPCWRQRWG